MAAAVYLKVLSPAGTSTVTLICSKTKVAPLNRLTIPRLELTAALLLAKLVSHVQSTLQLNSTSVTLWTDSAVALAWINSDPMRWKEFVKNRVQQIQQAAPQVTWKFISGKHNPADCASRGLSPAQLVSHPLWWSGPDWLANPNHLWPLFTTPDDHPDDAELRPSAVLVSATAQLPFIEWFEDEITLKKLVRMTALAQRTVACLKHVHNASLKTSPLTPADLQFALTFWIKATQQIYFASEIQSLLQGKTLAKSHPLTRLTAWVDQAGVLRVGGRLQNAPLAEDAKHPPILPRKSKISDLIIDNAHNRTLHGGTQLTLNYVRNYPSGEIVPALYQHGSRYFGKIIDQELFKNWSRFLTKIIGQDLRQTVARICPEFDQKSCAIYYLTLGLSYRVEVLILPEFHSQYFS